MFIGVWKDMWVCDSVSLVLLSVSMPIPDCFLNYSSVVEWSLQTEVVISPKVPVQNCFDYPVFFLFFVFAYEVEYCSFTVKNFAGILISIALNV